MAPDTRTGWTFSESMIEVRKPFEKFVKGFLIVGLSINVLVAGLLFTGVIKRPGVEGASKTQLVPMPSNWDAPHPAVSGNTVIAAKKRG